MLLQVNVLTTVLGMRGTTDASVKLSSEACHTLHLKEESERLPRVTQEKKRQLQGTVKLMPPRRKGGRR